MPTWAAEKGVAKAITASCRRFSKVLHDARILLSTSWGSLLAMLMSLVRRIGSCAPASSSTCSGIVDGPSVQMTGWDIPTVRP